MRPSKFNLIGIKGKLVDGLMSDPKRLAAATARIREATQKKFDEYARARHAATVAARSYVLD